MIVNANPVPYKPATLDTSKATLDDAHVRKRSTGRLSVKQRSRAAIGRGRSAAPRIRSRHAGPDADLRQGRLRSQAPLSGRLHRQATRMCSGIGFAAVPRRRIVLQDTLTKDDEGTAQSRGEAGFRGSSTAANRRPATSIRAARCTSGFTQDEASRQVYDGAWPIIAGKRDFAERRDSRCRTARGSSTNPGGRGPAVVGD